MCCICIGREFYYLLYEKALRRAVEILSVRYGKIYATDNCNSIHGLYQAYVLFAVLC